MEIHTVHSNFTISDIFADLQSQLNLSKNFSSSLLFK